MTATQLRRELSGRARAMENVHETTYGRDDWYTPSVLFHEDECGRHGNFYAKSYRAILVNDGWRLRLEKGYTSSSRVAYANARSRKELDCANSSDALLMNIFCCPGVLERPEVCAVLGLQAGHTPEFGVRMQTPRTGSRADRTEVDMVLGHLLVEAKLTETGFQKALPALVESYCDLAEVFDVEELPRSAKGDYLQYQLVRGALAAFHCGKTYLLLCDARRPDLREAWFRVIRCVRGAELRSRMALLTWQELAMALPKELREYLEAKYGIVGS